MEIDQKARAMAEAGPEVRIPEWVGPEIQGASRIERWRVEPASAGRGRLGDELRTGSR